jgi:uncharacterized protein
LTVSRETAAHADCDPGPSVSRETVTSASAASPSLLARAVLAPIRGYRRFISPALGQRCRYYPSCSAYAEEAVRELGAFRGTILAVWRVLRCNPFTKGGLDPVSDRRLFRRSAAAAKGVHPA